MLYLAADRTSYLAVSSCEKFRLDKRTWKDLPDMNETRRYFNPCLFKAFIYLCGYSATIQVFSPKTDTFLPVPICFPEKTNCCLYEDEGLLVVRSKTYMMKLAAGQEGPLGEPLTTRAESMSVYQSSQPVVYQGCVYMIQGGAIVRFDKKTGAVVKG